MDANGKMFKRLGKISVLGGEQIGVTLSLIAARKARQSLKMINL